MDECMSELRKEEGRKERAEKREKKGRGKEGRPRLISQMRTIKRNLTGSAHWWCS